MGAAPKRSASAAAKRSASASASKSSAAKRAAPKRSRAKKPVKALKAVSARRNIFNGAAKGGKNMSTSLTKDKLTKNKHGRVVSKAQSARGKKNGWINACNAARKALNIKGFQVIKKGTALYNKAKALYKK